jgi:hypothetical protein
VINVDGTGEGVRHLYREIVVRRGARNVAEFEARDVELESLVAELSLAFIDERIKRVFTPDAEAARQGHQ